MQDYIVYLANSSGIKVGITRHSQIPTRWLDQGAMQAIPIARVATRQLSGLLEGFVEKFGEVERQLRAWDNKLAFAEVEVKPKLAGTRGEGEQSS